MNKLNEKQLKELAIKARREYHREWRRNNPDKVREYREKYWQKKALEILAEEEQQQK